MDHGVPKDMTILHITETTQDMFSQKCVLMVDISVSKEFAKVELPSLFFI